MSRTRFFVVAAFLAAACGNSKTEEAAPAPSAPVVQAAAPVAPTAPVASGPVVDDPTFELRGTMAGPLHAGQAGTVSIALSAKGDFHVNQEYPIRVTFHPEAGVTLAKPELARADAAEFAEKKARFDESVTVAVAGTHKLVAEVDFAVCSASNCMPDHRSLSIDVAAQ